MALKATIYKLTLHIADMDRGYYQDHQLTIAKHPSETEQRLMMRLMAFVLNASEQLSFAKGLSNEGEAELLEQELSGEINLWIEFGQSDEKWLRKACGQAKEVQLFTYGGKSVPPWWQKIKPQLERYKNLKVINFPEESIIELGKLAQRNMELQINISEQQMWISDADNSLLLEPEYLLGSRF